MINNFYFHENNLQNKINNNYRHEGESLKKFKDDCYDLYKKNQNKITDIDKEAIEDKVIFLSNYYEAFDKFNEGNWITHQSKCKPTILEEFCGYLFKDLPIIKELDLNFFNKKIYAGLTINHYGKVDIKTKDVDFCIGKKIEAKIVEENYEFIVPIIAIECKTYLDKTMFNEAQFSSQKLKYGSPNVRTYILSHANQVRLSEIPRKGQSSIDQLFIISDDKGKVISDAVYEFFIEIKEELDKFQKEIKEKKIGGILL
jgi:hypothetical protein